MHQDGKTNASQYSEEANKLILQNTKQAEVAEILLNLQPLGLDLHVTPFFMESMQRLPVLSHRDSIERQQNFNRVSEFHSEKLKASNFCVLTITIGNWRVVAKNDGDLVAKCYFAKKRLVWEILDSGLKSKIEIPWSDIIGINAVTGRNQPGILSIELKGPPTFHEESDPQPRKHTIWRIRSDFTGGQASTFRRHFLEFPPGILDEPYENLLQSDPRLKELSRSRFPTSQSLCFEPEPSPIYDSPFSYDPHIKVPTLKLQSNEPGFPGYMGVPSFRGHTQSYDNELQPRKKPSPISVMDFSSSSEDTRMASYGQVVNYADTHARDQGLASGGAVQSAQLNPAIPSQNYNFLQDNSRAVTEQTHQTNILLELERQLFDDSKVGNYNTRVQSLNELVTPSMQDNDSNFWFYAQNRIPEVNSIPTGHKHGLGPLPLGGGLDDNLVFNASEYPGGLFYQQQPFFGIPSHQETLENVTTNQPMDLSHIPSLAPQQETSENVTTNQPWDLDFLGVPPQVHIENVTTWNLSGIPFPQDPPENLTTYQPWML